MVVKISLSVLSLYADKIFSLLDHIQDIQVDSFHIDVMDGHFVPNLAFGTEFVKTLAQKQYPKPFSVHLMCEPAENFVPLFIPYHPHIIFFHIEATPIAHKLVEDIKSKGIKVGIAMRSLTPIEWVKPLLPLIDNCLVMTVHPGFGGQMFLTESLHTISSLKKYIGSYRVRISVDGGINEHTAKQVVEAGADELHVGSYITQSYNKGSEPINIHIINQQIQKILTHIQ